MSFAEGADGPRLDLELLLPLELIREHTKTADIVTVSDELLRLYRASGFEAAETFTGRTFSRKTWITEAVRVREYQRSVSHKLAVAPMDGVVYTSGPLLGRQTVRVPVNSRRVRIGLLQYPLAIDNCCRNDTRGGDMIGYYAGAACADTIPTGIKVGVLKYIAFLVQHPGDITQAVSTQEYLNSRIVVNNTTLASGALSEWAPYRPRTVV